MTHPTTSNKDLKQPSKSRIYWFVGSVVALIVAVYTGLDMVSLMDQEKLWGYRPVSLLFWSYFFFSFIWAGIRNVSGTKRTNYLLATVSGILLGISLPPLQFLPLIVIGWAIILFLSDRVLEYSWGYRYRLFFHVFIIWNIIATYWIANTAFAAGIAAIFTNSLLMACPLVLFNYLRKNMPAKFHFILFAACWIGFEYFHFRWEAHWPWLALGHYFMEMPWIVQWYEWTGILGGSLWILGLSWLVYRILQSKKSRRPQILLALTLVLPIIISCWIGAQPMPSGDEINVAIVQPNYEPHYVKGKIPKTTEVNHFLNLSNQVVTDQTDYLIFPETSFSINLNKWDRSISVLELNRFLDSHSNLTLVSGLETNKILQDGESHDQYTRTYARELDTIYWENHNTAVRMAKTLDKELYYKSKLVPGAEFFPFKKTLFFLKPLMDKLGGSGSGLRKQDERSAFQGLDGHKVAPVICYESVYGEYVSDYFEKGAEWIAVMTNDGWWDNTAGHKQHLGLSVLRAIEQRKWIARSANTGISCFINPKGEIIQPTKYGVEAAITGVVFANSERTIYSKMGDAIGRLFLLLLAGMILFSFMRKFK